jgi:hypothetical protein
MRTPRAMTSPQSSQVVSRSQGRAPTASGGAAGGSNISSMRLHHGEDFFPFGRVMGRLHGAGDAPPLAEIWQVHLGGGHPYPGAAATAGVRGTAFAETPGADGGHNARVFTG